MLCSVVTPFNNLDNEVEHKFTNKKRVLKIHDQTAFECLKVLVSPRNSQGTGLDRPYSFVFRKHECF